MSSEPEKLAISVAAAAGRGALARVTWRQWAMVCALTLLYIYAQIDGSAIILMVDPIKRDLGVSDTEMSLLLGLSFAACYAVFGLPAGYLVDRTSRRAVIGVGVVLWSAMTASCGLAATYWQLFLGRCGIGVGEAAITPASYSLIRDGFAPDNRGRAYGIFTAGTYIGAALAAMLAGALLAAFASGKLAGLPLLGHLRPWQAVFMLMGLVGIPLSLVVLTFREPVRSAGGAGDAGVHFSEAIAHMKTARGQYTALILFVTCFFGTAISYGAWMPTVIGRTFHLPPQTIGLFFGLTLLICAPIGAMSGGFAIDYLTKRGHANAAEIVGVWITAIFIPFGIWSPIAPSVFQMFFALAAQLLVAGAYNPVAASLLARITPQRVMGKVTAVYLFIQTLIARTLGPLLVGAASDLFFSGNRGVGYALGTVAGVLMFIALAAIVWLLVQARTAEAKAIA
jgi:MFS family permease